MDYNGSERGDGGSRRMPPTIQHNPARSDPAMMQRGGTPMQQQQGDYRDRRAPTEGGGRSFRDDGRGGLGGGGVDDGISNDGSMRRAGPPPRGISMKDRSNRSARPELDMNGPPQDSQFRKPTRDPTVSSQSRDPRLPDRSDTRTRPDRPDRVERPLADKPLPDPSRSDRPDRDRTDRPDRSDRSMRIETQPSNRYDRPPDRRQDRPDRGDRPERAPDSASRLGAEQRERDKDLLANLRQRNTSRERPRDEAARDRERERVLERERTVEGRMRGASESKRTNGVGINDLLADLDKFSMNGDAEADSRSKVQNTSPRNETPRSRTEYDRSDAVSSSGRSERERRRDARTDDGAGDTAISEGGELSSRPSRRDVITNRRRSRTVDTAKSKPTTDRDGATTQFEDESTTLNGAGPPIIRKRNGSVSSSATALEPSIADPDAIRQMVPDVIADTKNYTILHPDRIDERKREFAVLSSQVASLQNRLTLESKIREAALNVVKSTGRDADRAQKAAAQEQLAVADRKVNSIATDLWKVTGKLMEVERVILKHSAGVLRWATENSGGRDKLSDLKQSSATKLQLESAETKIKEYELEITALKSTVARVEAEAADSRGMVSKEQENLRKAERELKSSERLVRSLESELKSFKQGTANFGSSAEVNRLKLEIATIKAEHATHQEEISTLQDKLSKSVTQHEDDQANIEEKDRMIANLLSELEEATTRLEMKTAEADALISGKSSGGNSERQLRAQVAALEAQLKEFNSASLRSPTRTIPSRGDSARSEFDKQLNQLKGQLDDERNKVRELESELRDRSKRLGSASRRNGGRGGSDSEDDGPRKGRSSVDEADLRKLKRLWVEMSSNGDPTATFRSDDPRFTVDDMVSRATGIMKERKNLQRSVSTLQQDLQRVKDDMADASRQVKSLETDLKRARDEATDSSRQLKALDAQFQRTREDAEEAIQQMRGAETREREMRMEIRTLERTSQRLKEDLEVARKQNDDQESMRSVGHSKKLAEMKSTHENELARLADQHKKAMRDLENDLLDAQERRIIESRSDLERKLADIERNFLLERDDLNRQLDAERSNLRKIESSLQDQSSRMEDRLRSELDKQALKYKKDLEEAVEQERSRALRVRDSLEAELDELQQQLLEISQTVDLEAAKRVKEVEERMEREHKRKIDAAEQSFRDQMDEAREAFSHEIENRQLAHTAEIERLKSQLESERKRALADAESQFKTERNALDQEMKMRLSGELEALKSKHTREIDQLKDRHRDDIAQLKGDHTAEVTEMKGRLARSEAALVSTKSQFFEDRERYQEQIDQLDKQVRELRTNEQQQASNFALKQKELEMALDKLRVELSSSQSQTEQAKDEIDRKVREMAQMEQKHRLKITEVEDEFNERVRDLEQHLEDFEAVRAELESVERDYMAELSKYDAEKLKTDRELAEALEAQKSLRQQLETTQRRLDQAQREVQEARSLSRRDPAFQSDIDRLQKTIVELKSAKNELLEELDNQGIRLQATQKELNQLQKDYDKILRNIRDWDGERKRYENIMSSQREEIASLQTRLQEYSIDRLGYSKASDEPPSTQKLRSEFRKLTSDLRADYTSQLQREVTLRSQLEAHLKQANKNRDNDLYNRHDLGTQTSLKWLTGDEPQRVFYGV